MLSFLVANTIIGIIATGAMSSFLWIITGLGIMNVDMIRAIGSIYTRSEDKAILPGMMMHFTAGIIFSYFYFFMFKIFPMSIEVPIMYVVLSFIVSMMHGLIVSLLLVVLVASHHPVEKYQKAGFGVAVYHFLAHLVYGLVLGILYTIFLA